MRRSKLAVIAAVLMASALVAGGCGDDSDDTSAATDETTSSAVESTPTAEESSTTAEETTSSDDPIGGVETTLESSLSDSGVSDVACPDDAEAAAGATFTCDLSGSGGVKGSIDVTLKDETGSNLSYKGSIEDGSGYKTTLSGSIKTS